jgi:hypothetical protein
MSRIARGRAEVTLFDSHGGKRRLVTVVVVP